MPYANVYKPAKRKMLFTREVIARLAANPLVRADAPAAVSVNCTQEGHSLCLLGCTTTVA